MPLTGGLRPLLGFLLACLVKGWVWTWRVRLVGVEHLVGARPRVFAFWHGQQMVLIAAPRRAPLTTLVSWSRDGALQACVMRTLGLRVVRGSSSRGAAAGLLAMTRAVRSGSNAAFAVDGPRGPARLVKPGALAVARQAEALLLPVGAAAAHSIVLGSAWDAFQVPLPFTRVVIVVGRPFCSTADPSEAPRLAEAIEASCSEAQRCVENWRGSSSAPLPSASHDTTPSGR